MDENQEQQPTSQKIVVEITSSDVKIDIDAGVSFFQLFGVADMLRMQAEMTFAAELAQQARNAQQSRIEVVRGTLPLQDHKRKGGN